MPQKYSSKNFYFKLVAILATFLILVFLSFSLIAPRCQNKVYLVFFGSKIEIPLLKTTKCTTILETIPKTTLNVKNTFEYNNQLKPFESVNISKQYKQDYYYYSGLYNSKKYVLIVDADKIQNAVNSKQPLFRANTTCAYYLNGTFTSEDIPPTLFSDCEAKDINCYTDTIKKHFSDYLGVALNSIQTEKKQYETIIAEPKIIPTTAPECYPESYQIIYYENKWSTFSFSIACID
jgi:hypothetical protein